MHKPTLGEQLLYYRKRARLSQLDLELEIDASPGMICRIEKGKVNPQKETILAIAVALGLSALETASLMGLDISKLMLEIVGNLEIA